MLALSYCGDCQRRQPTETPVSDGQNETAVAEVKPDWNNCFSTNCQGLEPKCRVLKEGKKKAGTKDKPVNFRRKIGTI